VNDQRPGSRPVGVLVAGVLFAAAAAGFLAHRLTNAPRLAGAPGKVTTDTLPAPGVPAATPETRAHPIPEQLPAVVLPDRHGATRQLTDWEGKPLLINFWATWCEPCRREIPLLRTLRHEHRAEGLEVVGIAIDDLAAVQQYAAEHAIDYPVLIGEQGGLAAASAFGMEVVLPFSVFADHSGRIVALKVGELHRDEAELILQRVHDVDTGRLTLPGARTEISEGLQRLTQARATSGSLP
jgi:peroxiredoxin